MEKFIYIFPNLEGEGIEINFLNKTVLDLRTAFKEKISSKNLKIIKEAVAFQLDKLEKNRLATIKRINQKEDVIRVPIPEGAIYYEKLSPKRLEVFKAKRKRLESEIQFLKELNYRKLVR